MNSRVPALKEMNEFGMAPSPGIAAERDISTVVERLSPLIEQTILSIVSYHVFGVSTCIFSEGSHWAVVCDSQREGFLFLVEAIDVCHHLQG